MHYFMNFIQWLTYQWINNSNCSFKNIKGMFLDAHACLVFYFICIQEQKHYIYIRKPFFLCPSVLSVWFRLRWLNNVPGSEHLIGSSESHPVCGAWPPDSVACSGGDWQNLLLASADGGDTAGGGDGHHYQIHTQCWMEMVRLCYNPMNDINILTVISLKLLQNFT